jgi:iron only hydrogenase large subunit-like protein
MRDLLPESAIRIVSGWKNCDTALQEFEQNKEIRFLDILFCEGGCMNGPGIVSSLSLEDRKKKIQDFITQTG